MPDACQAHQRQHSQTFSLFILAFQHVLVLTSIFWDAMRTGLSLDSFMWDCLWTSLVNITRAPLLPSTEDCTSKCPSGRQRYGTVCGQWNCPRRWRVSLLRPDTLTHASLVCLFYHRTGGPHVSDGVVSVSWLSPRMTIRSRTPLATHLRSVMWIRHELLLYCAT